MEKNKIVEILKDKNIKVTNNRVAILDCLADETHFHTVGEIVEHIGTINTKSVYNNIKVLISEGIVDTYSFGGISKYAINDHYKDNHDVIHVVDGDSKVSHIDINNKIISSIKKEVEKAGYEPSTVNIFVNIKK